MLLNRTKKEDEQKRAKKEEQRVFWSSQEKIREISWEGHVLAKRKRVDGSRFRLKKKKIYSPPYKLIF